MKVWYNKEVKFLKFGGGEFEGTWSVWGVESCKMLFLRDISYSLVQILLLYLFLVRLCSWVRLAIFCTATMRYYRGLFSSIDRLRYRSASTYCMRRLHWLRVPERIDYKVTMCWRTKFYMEVRGVIWDHSFLLPISPAPIVWWCHLSDVQQSVTGCSYGCWTPSLEHSAGGDNDVADALYLPSTT